jgi:pyruvate/2-oxoacid:ferredoxin oxidoreductase beta subunit
MATKTLDELSEGMITKEPVLDPLGNVVLREGVELTRKIITALKHRGITRIVVNKPDNQEEKHEGLTNEERERMCQQVEEKIDRLFAGHKDKKMLELAEAAKRYHKSKIR